MEQEIWIKEVENQVLKPIDEWRNELYGYWMVYSDVKQVNGVEMAVARYYGTDKIEMYKRYTELHAAAEEPTVGILLNKRGNNWMGGVFLVKAES